MTSERRPTSAAERALAVLDVGVQQSTETGYDPNGFPAHDDPSLCARCQQRPLGAEGGMCVGCRAFMLGDTDDDPRRRRAAGGFSTPVSPNAVYLRRVERGHAPLVGQEIQPLVDLGRPVPGRPVLSVTRLGGTTRITRLDADGNPVGQAHEIPDDVTVTVTMCGPGPGPTWHDEATAAWDAVVADLAASLNAALRPVAEAVAHVADAFASCGRALGLLDTTEEDRRRRDRERSRAVVAVCRRQHRRTNRLGPPPGRR